MGIPRTLKAGLDSALGLIAKRLRGESEASTREALPERWIELIHNLDEQERLRNHARQAQPTERKRSK